MTIGETLRAAREAKGWSRRDLALCCQLRGRPVHENSIYRLEVGRHKGTRLELVEVIVAGLGLRLVLESKRRKSS